MLTQQTLITCGCDHTDALKFTFLLWRNMSSLTLVLKLPTV